MFLKTSAQTFILVLGLLINLTAWAEAPAGLLWQHDDGLENWVAKVVSIGAKGSLVTSSFGPFQDYTRTFSSFAQSPPTPVFQYLNPNTSFHHSVDSAEMKDLRVVAYDEYANPELTMRRVYLKRYSFETPAQNCTYVHPTLTNGHEFINAQIARDGSKFVLVVHDIWTNKEQVVVFNPSSCVPIASFPVDVTGPFRAVRLSADGKVLYVSGGIKIVLVDIPSGTVRHSAYIFSTLFNAHGISGDGSIFAYGTYGQAKVFKRNPTTGQYALAITHTMEGQNLCDQLAISDDGLTMAVGYNFYDFHKTVRIEAVDLTSGAVTMSDTVTGIGTLQNIVSGISISADGKRFGVGLWGDEGGAAKEVRAYRRDQNAAIFTADLPGSVFAIDLSADGKRLAVASKAIHANSPGGGGSIGLYRIEDEDFVLQSVPHAGASVAFNLHGTPGSPAQLLYSPNLEIPPTTFPGMGTLYVDRQTLSHLPMSTVNQTGVATGNFQIPAATPAGTFINFQGFTSSPRHLTEDWVPMMVLP